MRLAAALAAAALAFCSPAVCFPALAATPGATVRIGADDITVPAPEGYCVAKGPSLAWAERSAREMGTGVLLLAMVDCQDLDQAAPRRAITLVGPVGLLAQPIDRGVLLDSLGEGPPSDFQQAFADMAKTRSNAAVKIDMAVKPVARDDSGYYLAGALGASNGADKVSVAIAMGLTSVERHVVVYTVLALTDDEAAGAVKALGEARSGVRGLIAANEP